MKVHRRLLSATAALVFLSILAPARSADAQEPAGATQAHGDAHVEEARKHAKTGLEFYDDGNFEAARIELEKAYKIAPSFKLLYNIGLCYRQLNNYVEAVRALTRYLAEGGDQVPPDRKTEVQKVITEIQPRTASVEVSVDAPGASVMIDDEPVGTAPLSTPVIVNPGRRNVSATMPGRQAQAKVITLGASDTMKVELLLPLLPTAKEEKTDPKKLGLYISLAATGAFAVATGVTGLLALKAKMTSTPVPPSPPPRMVLQRELRSTTRPKTGILPTTDSRRSRSSAILRSAPRWLPRVRRSTSSSSRVPPRSSRRRPRRLHVSPRTGTSALGQERSCLGLSSNKASRLHLHLMGQSTMETSPNRLSGKRALLSTLVGAALLMGLVPSCTAIIDAQCSTDADCAGKGGDFQGYICSDSYCKPPPGYCTANAQCSNPAAPDDFNYFCDRSARLCKKLAPDGCFVNSTAQEKPYLSTAVNSDDAVYVGTWSLLTGTNATNFGLSAQAGLDLAVHDVLQGGGLKDKDGKARPLVVINCDEADAAHPFTDQMTYLMDTVHIKAVVGPVLSPDSVKAAPLVIGRKTLHMVHHANGVALSGLDPNQNPHFFYRTSLSDALFLDGVSAFVEKQLEPALKGPGGPAASGPLRIVIVNKDDPHGTGSGAAAVEKLKLNGKPYSDPSNSANTKKWIYPASGDQHSVFVNIMKEMIPLAPHVIFFVGTGEGNDLYNLVETNWPAGKPKPFWIYHDILPPPDLTRDQKHRMVADYPGPGPQYNSYAQALADFTKKSVLPCCLTHESAEAYDAFYLSALAIGGAGSGGSGGDIVGLIPQFRSSDPSALTVKIGPAGFGDGVNALLNKKPVRVQGASGPLSFKPTGDTTGSTIIECYKPDSSAPNDDSKITFGASTLLYDNETNTQSGDLSSCLPLL